MIHCLIDNLTSGLIGSIIPNKPMNLRLFSTSFGVFKLAEYSISFKPKPSTLLPLVESSKLTLSISFISLDVNLHTLINSSKAPLTTTYCLLLYSTIQLISFRSESNGNSTSLLYSLSTEVLSIP